MPAIGLPWNSIDILRASGSPFCSLRDSVADSQPVIDALSAHVALLDRQGAIVAVNEAWLRFSSANGGEDHATGIGTNYLDLLDRMQHCVVCSLKERADLHLAQQVAAGIREVLAGRAPRFQIEYPCDGPHDPRWFLLTVTPFAGDSPLAAVVSHEEVTRLKLAEEKAVRQNQQLMDVFGSTVNAISLAVEKRDPYTAGHQNQVARLCDAMAARLGIDGERRNGLRLGAIIHDIGKISVPAEILAKPGKLSVPEMQIIRTHPQTGHDILCGIDFPWPIADMVRQHHERLDGSGYPYGLKGDEICLEARIITVADVYDAITSHRPYRAARPQHEGLAVLHDGAGKLFDPQVVDALITHLDSEIHEEAWGI